ncbi:hypothetical protein [Pseudobacteriovorax antillogorgiicola]|uniref:Uncharacterized protein n=1 Tax=Pseudobacteriovorax antillogorgiicola TaxID=1513793 RepID=A0A1Y6BJX7_9BACT|nr:hypothetical protein [Pseudobacteriovorax antillogorgiicola]TCS56301.1 hypothetical protein EDD56_104123 [Pseudobacteriovorax antillogorgiicola]SMF07339.1 hypothetical protein SAMN06296036_104210 [Pseudobacteriovorax antillogorgiicola]
MLKNGITVITILSSSAAFSSVESSKDILDSLSSENIGNYIQLESISSGNIGVIDVPDFYETKKKMQFRAYNGLPVMNPQIFIKELSCKYSYVDVWSFPDGSGVAAKQFRTWPGREAILESDQMKCVVEFECTYTLAVDGENYTRTFDPIKVNIDDHGGKGCFEFGRIKLVNNG